MHRREFLALAAPALAAAGGRTIEKNGWRLRVDERGEIVSLRHGATEWIAPQSGGKPPRASGPAGVTSDVDLVALDGGGVAVKQTIRLERRSGERGTVRVDVPLLGGVDPARARRFLPLKNGIGRRTEGAPLAAAYELAGAHAAGQPASLAIPLLHEWDSGNEWGVTRVTDPGFTTAFSDTIHWTYSEALPLPDGEQRTVYTCFHRGGPEAAMRAWYATALHDVPEGPDWLHEVAMAGYDYLSENGRGWFADIDVLEKAIAPPDRPQVLLAMHGWYDWCGRYTFDLRTRALDRQWLALPASQDPAFQKLAERPDNGSPFYWAPANIRKRQPVEMTLAEMHGRIRYAKSRGFRVALYFADGLNACDGIPGFDPARVLRWGGWTGPDTRGRSYAMNPLHPDVPAFFKAYLNALLDEYGKEVDAFIWDETFYVQPDDLGAGAHRGYAARAMMQLMKDLTRATSAARRDLAFLASDDVGIQPRYRAPYALMAHGTYQDSACLPRSWPYGLFPNFRNTIWSCNWAPLKTFANTTYAAEVFDVAVAISNGYGEDRGVAELTPDELQRVLDLFERRKRRRMEITWIEETDAGPVYRGRPVKAL